MTTTHYRPADDVRAAMNERSQFISKDFEEAWSRFLVNHRNASRFENAHELVTQDWDDSYAVTNWRKCWYRIEQRIWTKHEQAAYRSLATTVECPNPACRHSDCQRTDVFCPMCGCPHTENITRGGLKPARA